MTRAKDEPQGKVQTAIRLDADVIERIDALAEKRSRPGLVVTRTDIMRMALEAGLLALERERGHG